MSPYFKQQLMKIVEEFHYENQTRSDAKERFLDSYCKLVEDDKEAQRIIQLYDADNVAMTEDWP